MWSLNELPNPLVAATRLDGVTIPPRSRVVTAATYSGDRTGFELRKNTDLKGSFAVDAQSPRALLFLGEVRLGALALWTVDERLIERLRSEFQRVWSRSVDHVERVKVADVVSRPNLAIQTEGTVQDIVPYRGNFLLRLSDGGDTIGVMVDKDLPVRGRKVSVTGFVRTSSSGYPLVEAVEVAPVA